MNFDRKVQPSDSDPLWLELGFSIRPESYAGELVELSHVVDVYER